MSITTLNELLERARQKLFEVRKKRVHPLKDDKILTDWNGLMIAALAKAARILEEPEFSDVAKQAVRFIFKELYKDGHLQHRFRQGEALIPAFLDDYAFMIWGLLELYETTFEPQYLENALILNEVLVSKFWDDKNGGFFFNSDDAEALLVRKKEAYDGAIPSGNSVAMLNLLRLSRITTSTSLEAKAVKTGQAFSGDVAGSPGGFTFMLSGVDFAVGPTFEIALIGDPKSPDTQSMLRAITEQFIPNKVLVLIPESDKEHITRLAPFTKEYTRI